jgi:two-component system, OmpR family, torCAD operon response regulator TorR
LFQKEKNGDFMKKFGRLLIVEDDLTLREVIAAYLGEAGFQVLLAENAKEFYTILAKGHIDLVLLDLELPDEDGLVLARQLKSKSDVPFIIVTGRGDREDRITGLELGADDYVTKPFDPRELILRINNVLNRKGSPNKIPPRRKDIQTVQFGGWNLLLDERSLIHDDGREATLTRAEFDLLASLGLAQGRVKSRDSLIDAISYGNEPPSDRAIDILVSRIRKKVEKNSKRPEWIKTVAGHGYRLLTNKN